MDAKDYLEVIQGATLGYTVGSLTASPTKAYDLTKAVDLLVADGLARKEAEKWITRMNNTYVSGGNPVFVAPTPRDDLGFVFGG